MNVFDTLFPKRNRVPNRTRTDGGRPHGRLAERRNRLHDLETAEQLEQRFALAVVTPFTVAYETNARGDITIAANTLMTSPGNTQAAIDARNGVGSNLNNDAWQMAYVDIDGDATTFNSSSANLVMPADADVLFAGLYWGARANSAVSNDVLQAVKFRGPGDAAYLDITGAVVGKTIGGVSNLPANVQTYGAYEDVTSLVQSRGAGTYTTANVKGDPGIINHFAGWSLVVVYESAGEIVRNLAVFNGFADIRNTVADRNVIVPFSGFIAPPNGPVEATIGLVTYEGDLGITGDSCYRDGGSGEVQLSNALNPANNFFNSSITNRGVRVTTKNPDYVNQLGFGADLIAANGIINNGATSAEFRLTTTQDQYYPGVVTSAIELYSPDIEVVKSVVDVNGGEVIAGDTLRYTVTVSNDTTALDAAVDVILKDVIPANTTYKPGSLVVIAGANAGPKTDAPGDDQAEFDAIGNFVQFQLGTGATAFQGGRLAAGQSSTITFDVTINADVAVETLIRNTAVSTFVAETSRFELSEKSDFTDIVCKPSADLSILKTDGSLTYVPGQNLTYTVTVTNLGPSTVTGATVSDVLPAGVTFVSASNGATYNAGTNTVSFTSGTLIPAGTTNFTITILPDADRTGDLVNTAVVAPPEGWTDPNPGNNSSTDTNTVSPVSDLSILKTDGSVTYVPGQNLTYTVTVTNNGPSTVTGATVSDVLPAGVTFVSATGGATFNAGTNTVNFTAGILAPAGSTNFTITILPAADRTGDLVNAAVVAPPEGWTDPNPGNNSSTDTNTVAPVANLSILKTDGSLTYVPGQNLTYTVTVTNLGPSTVTGATVSDVLPVGVTFVSATGGATYNAGTNTVSFTSGLLAPAGSTNFTITMLPAADRTGDLVNTAVVAPPQGVIDPNPGNNSSTDTNTVAPRVVLEITKTGPLTYKAGGFISYTIEVTNNGPSVGAGIDFVDALPANIESWAWSVSFTTGSGAFNGSPVSGTGNIATKFTLAVNGKATISIVDAKTLAAADTDITNTASATPPNGTTVSATWSSAFDGPINPSADIRALAVGSDDGCNGLPWVRVIDPYNGGGAELSRFLAYESSFRGSVRVATGDVTGDGIPEIVVGPGRNRVGQIRVFTPNPVGSTNYSELVAYRTLAFGPAYRGGVEVTVGDVNGDGVGDIIAGQSSGAGLVRVFLTSENEPLNTSFDGVANTPYRSFRAFPASYRGGVMVAAGDFGTYANGVKTNGSDGIAEIAVGSNAGIRATVKVFDVSGTPRVVRTIQPFGAKFKGGVTLSVANYNGDSISDLIVGAGVGGRSLVEIYDGNTFGTPVKSSAFASFSKLNARAFTAALDTVANPGRIENIYGVKGLNGGGGAKGVRVANRDALQTSSLLPNTNLLAPPLRIAPIIVRVAG